VLNNKLLIIDYKRDKSINIYLSIYIDNKFARTILYSNKIYLDTLVSLLEQQYYISS